jgi:hypothetical protein
MNRPSLCLSVDCYPRRARWHLESVMVWRRWRWNQVRSHVNCVANRRHQNSVLMITNSKIGADLTYFGIEMVRRLGWIHTDRSAMVVSLFESIMPFIADELVKCATINALLRSSVLIPSNSSLMSKTLDGGFYLRTGNQTGTLIHLFGSQSMITSHPY